MAQSNNWPHQAPQGYAPQPGYGPPPQGAPAPPGYGPPQGPPQQYGPPPGQPEQQWAQPPQQQGAPPGYGPPQQPQQYGPPQQPPAGYGPPQGAPQGYGAPQGPPPQGFNQPGYGPPGHGQPAYGQQQGGTNGGQRWGGADASAYKMAGSRYPFLPLGTHELEVVTTHTAPRSGSFVAEVKVVWTNNPQVARVGDVYSFVQTTANKDVAMPTIIAFVIAAIGAKNPEDAVARGQDMRQLLDAVQDDEKQITPKYPANPLKGRHLMGTVTPATGLKKDGYPKVYQPKNFSPMPDGWVPGQAPQVGPPAPPPQAQGYGAPPPPQGGYGPPPQQGGYGPPPGPAPGGYGPPQYGPPQQPPYAPQAGQVPGQGPWVPGPPPPGYGPPQQY